jgi:amidase
MNKYRPCKLNEIAGGMALIFLLSACGSEPVDFEELSVAELHDRMQRQELSSELLVAWYLGRIKSLDAAGPELNSIIEVNPDALTIARALDEEWQESGPRGPLHGIPIVLKANIDTGDRMRTSAGSLALADHSPPADAFLVSRLREAGAVILGKANLSEWANFRSDRSSSGWSSIGGQTRNPYDVARNPCGSSSGSAVAVAANLTVLSIGTETDGSIVCPSGANGIVGIKPTLGLVSRSGIIPIAHSQDTAGPMARSVRDAAILLGALAAKDPADSATMALDAAPVDYAEDLSSDGLTERRIGVIRSYYGAGSHPGVETILADSIAALENSGAVIVDDIEFDAESLDAMWAAEGEVLSYEFKTDLATYLGSTGAPLQTLAEIIEFNKSNADTVMPFFGQERMHEAQEKGPLTDSVYVEAAATGRRLAREIIDKALAEHNLDALIAPTNGPAWLTDHINGDSFHISSSSYAAVAGYPNVTVPGGFVSGLPVGISFIGTANAERALIQIAYAFEQATRARRPPEL